MTLMAAFGCGLIGFGPVGVIFILVIAHDPLQLILFTVSAFFWLVGLLCSSLIWFAVVPLRNQLAFGLVFACLLEELMRFLFYLLLTKSESGLLKLAEAELDDANGDASPVENSAVGTTDDSTGAGHERLSLFNLQQASFTTGLSFALMGCIIEYIYVFYDVLGPGTLMEGPNPGYFFIFAAIDSCCMALLKVAWSVVLFRSYRLRRYAEITAVVTIHILLSCLSLLNEKISPAPELVSATYALSVILSLVWAFHAAGGHMPFMACLPLDEQQHTDSQVGFQSS